MVTHVLLLRAVNVGGKNKVPMADLRAALENASFSDVRTYIQSGNIIAQSRRGADSAAKLVRKVIRTTFGHDIDVIVRSPDELRSIVDACPYPAENPKQVGVVFLAGPCAALDASAFAPDVLHVAGPDVYMHCPTSFADSKLTPAWIEKNGEQAGTRRNWNTVLKLVEMTAD